MFAIVDCTAASSPTGEGPDRAVGDLARVRHATLTSPTADVDGHRAHGKS